MLEAETSRSIFWMVQKKFKITTKTVRQFPTILPPSYSLIENLDVNFQYILDPGESNVSYAGIPFNRVIRLQVLDAWGLAGVRTDKIGFKHVWEIWYMHCLSQLDADSF